MSWAIVEQTEGLVVECQASSDVDLFLVDYDEAAQSEFAYAVERLEVAKQRKAEYQKLYDETGDRNAKRAVDAFVGVIADLEEIIERDN